VHFKIKVGKKKIKEKKKRKRKGKEKKEENSRERAWERIYINIKVIKVLGFLPRTRTPIRKKLRVKKE